MKQNKYKIHNTRYVSYLLWVILLTCITPASISQAQDANITLSPQKTKQTIEGFGASGAWWAQVVGGWPDAKRSEVLNLLYGADGIGLTIYRYNIGAGSGKEIGDHWRRAEGFLTAPGRYDWSKDANAVWAMKKAHKLGAEHIVLFANSPPPSMTVSGLAFGVKEKGLSNLRPDMHQAFAEYLVDITEHFIRDESIPVSGISPINEPQWDWDGTSQEGCHYEADEVAHVTELVIRQLKKRSLDVKVEAIESASWEKVEDIGGRNPMTSPVYVDTLFANKYLRDNLDGYALHSYWATRERKEAFAKYFYEKYPEKKLYMTEWCEMKGGRDYGMDSALKLAEEITEDLVVGGVSSWQLWIAVSRYNFRDGLIYVNEKDKEILQTKRLWAMGNFSRFIRPGFLRITTSGNPKGLKIVAAKNPDNNTLVAVVINPQPHSISAKVSMQGEEAFSRLTAYVTSEKGNLEKIPHNSGESSIAFPSQSITTLVYNR